jgi:hypothetical protein
MPNVTRRYENTSLPSYLFEPRDFDKDSVLHFCEKLAFEAHGGLYMEGLFDATMPAALNPLTAKEVLEWGDCAVKFVKTVERSLQ